MKITEVALYINGKPIRGIIDQCEPTDQSFVTSGDADVPTQEKLYGYHRLEDPFVTYMVDDELKICRWSEVEKQQAIPIGLVGRHDEQVQEEVVEPKKY